MISRRTFGIAALTAILVKPAFAQSEVPFSRAAFEAAQKEGKSILVEIHASWCPTCKAQKPIIDSLLGMPKFKDLVTFRMDFDAQASEVRTMGAQSQSTLVVFKGSKEVGRSVGDTNPASIEQLLAAGI
jgi:thiol-disulfide isomerase/thioredoxin